MGPSGSGKSSLLNILTGFTTNNFTGSIKINGSSKNFKMVRHTNESAYILQDESLFKLLTVRESMNFAIKFKTGNRFGANEQEYKRDSILKQLGLSEQIDSSVKTLSGGQQKRLSIAIELVSDPKILFLDEPTTGLDSSSSTQCIQLLKNLAREGRTIICSIHTPSARLFDQFDHLYVLARGNCIYQGSNKNLVPFLSEFDLVCPESYNPADYILEISTNDYGAHNDHLTKKMINGSNDYYRSPVKEIKHFKSDYELLVPQESKYAASFLTQLQLLIQRNFILMRRDLTLMLLRWFVSLFVAVTIGILFYNIGNLANRVFDNYKYAYTVANFLTYGSYFSIMVRCKIFFLFVVYYCSCVDFFLLSVPLDIAILRREHFNRWYSSFSYYLALSLADAPVLVTFCLIFDSVSYFMTGQPLETQRVVLLVIVTVPLCFIAQAWGLLAGSMFGLTVRSLIEINFHVFIDDYF